MRLGEHDAQIVFLQHNRSRRLPRVPARDPHHCLRTHDTYGFLQDAPKQARRLRDDNFELLFRVCHSPLFSGDEFRRRQSRRRIHNSPRMLRSASKYTGSYLNNRGHQATELVRGERGYVRWQSKYFDSYFVYRNL